MKEGDKYVCIRRFKCKEHYIVPGDIVEIVYRSNSLGEMKLAFRHPKLSLLYWDSTWSNDRDYWFIFSDAAKILFKRHFVKELIKPINFKFIHETK